MGASVSAAIAGVGTSEGWNNGDRAARLRQIFGAFLDQDCWAVSRKHRSIDDGNGYMNWEELKTVLHFEEFNLMFLWDVFSHQNEFVQTQEILVTMCLFSSARLLEKLRFLCAHFDSSRSGRNTGLELARACTAVLSVMGRCAGSAAKEKDVIPLVRAALLQISPAFADVVKRGGVESAFNDERMFGLDELENNVLPSLRAAYEQVSFSEPPPPSSSPPPPPGWAAGEAAVTRSRRTVANADATDDEPQVITAITKATELSQLAWMEGLNLDREIAVDNSADQQDFARLWMVMQGVEFKTIAKDVASFSRIFQKSVSGAIGVPLGCVEVLNVSQGSIIVEFLLKLPKSCSNDAPAVADRVLMLQQQLSSPFSALRRSSGLSSYVANAELMVREPRIDAHGSAVAERREPRDRADGETIQDFGVQTDSALLSTPKASYVRAMLSSLGPDVDAATAADMHEAAMELREAVQKLAEARNRTTRATQELPRALQQLKERQHLIAELEQEVKEWHCVQETALRQVTAASGACR